MINRLHSILRPFMLRRQKKDVETDLADKIEKVLRCELTPMQKAMYETILEGKVTMHNRVMQLRKIANVSRHTCAHENASCGLCRTLFLVNDTQSLSFSFFFFLSPLQHPILFHPYLRGMARSTPYTPDLDIIKMCGKFALLDQILHKLSVEKRTVAGMGWPIRFRSSLLGSEVDRLSCMLYFSHLPANAPVIAF